MAHTDTPPHVHKGMLNATYWIQRLGAAASQRLLDRGQIRALNARTREQELGVRTLPQSLTPDAKKKQTPEFHAEQQAFVHQKLQEGIYVESKPQATAAGDTRVASLTPHDDYFVLSQSTPVRCWPIEGGLFKPPIDEAFDRNNCSTLHPPAVVHRIASDTQDQWHYVQGEFVEGWVQRPSWRAVSAKTLYARLRGGHRWVLKDDVALDGPGNLKPKVRLGTILTTDQRDRVSWPGPDDWEQIRLRDRPELRKKPLPFTRENLFNLVFDHIGEPYGWGGYRGQRDCSRLLLDAFRAFGIQLPRWSGHQAQFGNSVDISMLSPKDKRATIRRFAETNVLLLFMPGHIMLYLGHEGDRDYAISAISEFVTPCKKPDSNEAHEQIHLLDRVTVTDLSLGLDAPRRSFLERITRMVRL